MSEESKDCMLCLAGGLPFLWGKSPKDYNLTDSLQKLSFLCKYSSCATKLH